MDTRASLVKRHAEHRLRLWAALLLGYCCAVPGQVVCAWSPLLLLLFIAAKVEGVRAARARAWLSSAV